MAEWTTESLRAALDSGDLGFWEEDNHGASSPDRRYGAWIETDDLPPPEEFDAWLAAHDAEIKAEALEEAAKEFAPDGTGNGRACHSWRVSEILRARAAAIRGEDTRCTCEWTSKDARWLDLLRKIGLGQGLQLESHAEGGLTP